MSDIQPNIHGDILYTDLFYEDPSLNIKPIDPDPNKEGEKSSFADLNIPNAKVFDFGEFKPYSYQASLFRELLSRGEGLKNVFWVLPRRSGKTEMMVIYLIIRALWKYQKSVAPYLKYGMLYPDLASGKEAAWEKLEHRTRGLPKRKTYENDGRVMFFLERESGIEIKITIQIVGLQDMDHRRGRGYDGVVADECATLPLGWRKVITPMISDISKEPTFFINIGTPNETGDFWDVYDKYKLKEDNGDKAYHTMWLSYQKLKHITPEAYERVKLELSPEDIAIEYGCKRGVNVSGRIFIEECSAVMKRGGVKVIEDDTNQMKWMVCDIGSSKRDFFAIWIFQLNYITGMWEAIDYNQIPSADADKVFKWVQGRGHKIGQIVLPFDGERGNPCMRDLLQGKFPQSEVQCLPKVLKVERIQYAKYVFPRVCFDKYRTNVGWNCLNRYSRVMNKQTRVFELSPRHDAFSHGADAFTYFATALISGILDIDLNNPVYKMRLSYDNMNRKPQNYDPMKMYVDDLGQMGGMVI